MSLRSPNPITHQLLQVIYPSDVYSCTTLCISAYHSYLGQLKYAPQHGDWNRVDYVICSAVVRAQLHRGRVILMFEACLGARVEAVIWHIMAAHCRTTASADAVPSGTGNTNSCGWEIGKKTCRPHSNPHDGITNNIPSCNAAWGFDWISVVVIWVKYLISNGTDNGPQVWKWLVLLVTCFIMFLI